MDVAWFLKERTAFLRFFYETGAQPFLDIKQKIEDEVEPFEQHTYAMLRRFSRKPM